MDMTRPVQADMSDFLARVGRHWWLAVLSVLAAMGAALVVTQHQAKVYESATSLLVQPVGDQDANVSGGRTKGEINLDTEAQLVGSTPVATSAAKLLQTKISPDVLADGVAVEVPANTSVLVITYSADDPKRAQAASHAFAEAYLQNRQDSATADLTNQLNTINGKLSELNGALGRVNGQLAGMRGDNPNRANLGSQRDTLQGQINTLTGRINSLSTTTVSAGRIIRDANLPTAPSKPNVLLNLASGATAGLLFSVGLALIRERLDRRVRRAADLTRRADLLVLANVPRSVKPRLDDVFSPFGSGGRIFNRLRNEVLASLPDLPSRIVVVTGASRGPSATLVAANLAAAFARTGSETVLISAQLPDSVGEAVPVTGLFDVDAAPGLSDVLAGRDELADVAQRAPRTPWLRVITTGGTASAGGLLQSQSLRDLLATLRREAEYVVIEAPSTASSADAQSLASVADAAILAVELRRTSYAQVVDASEQLRRVGTPVLGAVVMARLGRLAELSTLRPGPPSDEAASPRPSGTSRNSTRDERHTAREKGRAAELANSPTVVMTRIGAPSQPTADDRRSADAGRTNDDLMAPDHLRSVDRMGAADRVNTADRMSAVDHASTADHTNTSDRMKTADRGTAADHAATDEDEDEFEDGFDEDAEFDDGFEEEFEDDEEEDDDEDDDPIVHVGRPMSKPNGTAEQRKSTATGMLAALTEDGPLDATR